MTKHMGELGSILARWAKLSGTLTPFAPPPNPEAKLGQQPQNPVAQEASAAQEASVRGIEPIVDPRRKGASFAHRKFSERAIRNMVACGIDAPERLLYMTETQLNQISGIEAKSLEEIRAYRARSIPKGSSPRVPGQSPYHRATGNEQIIGLFLFGVCAGFVSYIVVALIF